MIAGLAVACLALLGGGLLAREAAKAPGAAPAPANWPVTETPPQGWKRLAVGNAFSFVAPDDTRTVALQGIDSRVGGYETDRFSVMFDYGRYSNSLSDEIPWSEIDGHRARLARGPGPCRALPGDEKDWPFQAAVYVELRPNPDRLALTMVGCAASEAGVEELQRLFLSLRFNPQA